MPQSLLLTRRCLSCCGCWGWGECCQMSAQPRANTSVFLLMRSGGAGYALVRGRDCARADGRFWGGGAANSLRHSARQTCGEPGVALQTPVSTAQSMARRHQLEKNLHNSRVRMRRGLSRADMVCPTRALSA
jgi:hypothetical protein